MAAELATELPAFPPLSSEPPDAGTPATASTNFSEPSSSPAGFPSASPIRIPGPTANPAATTPHSHHAGVPAPVDCTPEPVRQSARPPLPPPSPDLPVPSSTHFLAPSPCAVITGGAAKFPKRPPSPLLRCRLIPPSHELFQRGSAAYTAQMHGKFSPTRCPLPVAKARARLSSARPASANVKVLICGSELNKSPRTLQAASHTRPFTAPRRKNLRSVCFSPEKPEAFSPCTASSQAVPAEAPKGPTDATPLPEEVVVAKVIAKKQLRPASASMSRPLPEKTSTRPCSAASRLPLSVNAPPPVPGSPSFHTGDSFPTMACPGSPATVTADSVASFGSCGGSPILLSPSRASFHRKGFADDEVEDFNPVLTPVRAPPKLRVDDTLSLSGPYLESTLREMRVVSAGPGRTRSDRLLDIQNRRVTSALRVMAHRDRRLARVPTVDETGLAGEDPEVEGAPEPISLSQAIADRLDELDSDLLQYRELVEQEVQAIMPASPTRVR
eukprot:RCo036463